MDEKFERVGSLKMCVREGKWRNVTELKKNEDKGDEESGYLWRNGWMRKKEEKKLKRKRNQKVIRGWVLGNGIKNPII